jgi:hypothetical protein
LQHTVRDYSLQVPQTWLDFDPAVELKLAEQKAETINPCYAALLRALIGQETGAQFSLLTIDEPASPGNSAGFPPALAVGHAKAPASLPISLLIPVFSAQMNAVDGVTVIGTARRDRVDGMGAAQLTLDIEGMCDGQNRPVPTTGHQIYLVDGRDVLILTMISPNASYEENRSTFDGIGASVRKSR